MSTKEYIFLLLLHVLIGFVLFLFKPFSFIYSHGVILIGLLWVFRNRNIGEEALLVCAYIVGSELLVKMTKGYFIWEYAKYAIIIILLLGMYFRGISKNAIPYWIFLLLLVPGIIIGIYELAGEERIRQSIIFNILGPITLVISSLYCYQRPISLEKLMQVLLFMALPIVSSMVYSILYTPDMKEIMIHTGSNFATSGGYGPNQVATFFGMGMFVFFVRILFSSPNFILLLINLSVTLLLAYRALITFSRGGLITGIIIILFFLLFTYFKGNSIVRVKVSSLFILLGIGLFSIWLYSILLTGGLIEKRYKNQDALGREKESVFTGREKILRGELALFLEKPILGGGVGVGTKYREEHFDQNIASHNEISRMLAEHGLLGIIGLMILGFTPLILYAENRHHFFLLSFMLFWFLTLNHTAMRVAMPAFVYSLALLKVYIYETPTLPWKRRFGSSTQSHHVGNVGQIAES